MGAQQAAHALNTQVGGTHYKRYSVQPVEFAELNSLGTCQANVIKYVTRYRDKGGARDLNKALHYVDLLEHLVYQRGRQCGFLPATLCTSFTWNIRPEAYCEINGLDELQSAAVTLVCNFTNTQMLEDARAAIRGLLELCDDAHVEAESDIKVLRKAVLEREQAIYVAISRLDEVARHLLFKNDTNGYQDPKARQEQATAVRRTMEFLRAEIGRGLPGEVCA